MSALSVLNERPAHALPCPRAPRFRPPNALELRETGGESIVQIEAAGTTVKMKGQEAMKGPDAQGFTFDRAFQMDTKQAEVYTYGISGIVDGKRRHRSVV